MRDTGATDRVRRFAAQHYVIPARRRNETILRIHSGESAKSLAQNNVLQPNRFPIICNALKSQKFLDENHLTLIEIQTPPTVTSGRSSTVTFVYRLNPSPRNPANQAHPAGSNKSGSTSFMALRGILKVTYKKLGGAAAFHSRESESWDQ